MSSTIKMLTPTRVSELLDYASVYGEFNERTPVGTVSTHGTTFSVGQQHALIAYKKVLGLLPADFAVLRNDRLPDDVRRLVIAARIVTDADAGSDEVRDLFEAVEPFSSRVPYEDQPCAAPGCTNITSRDICDDCDRWVQGEAEKLSGEEPKSSLPPFVQPTAVEFATAARIVDSQPVTSAYAACEWAELGDDGKVWIAAIVREAARDARDARVTSADQIVHVNAFLTHMADRFRERTSRRLLGIRINTMTRTEAMGHALATYDATLDMIGAPFGHPDHEWDRAAAHSFVDEEIQHWER